MQRSGAEKVYAIPYGGARRKGRVLIRATSHEKAALMAKACGLFLTRNELQRDGELTRDPAELAVASETGVWFREDMTGPAKKDKYRRLRYVLLTPEESARLRA